MQRRALSCWQCGTVVSTGGGRCPACGAEQPPTPEGPATDAAGILRSGRPSGASEREFEGDADARRSSGALPWAALAVGLAIIGAGVALLRPRAPDPTDAPALPVAGAASGALPAKASPNDLGPFDPRAVDPMEVLGKARTRALAWSKDALLVSMRARPVLSGRVDIGSGGTIEYFFGTPTGEGLGPGTKVSGKRLRIVLASAGTQIEETNGPAARAALEPNCPLDAAAHAAIAAGLPRDAPLLASYDLTEKLAQKPVWHISADGKEAAQRQIDGISCAVLVR